MSTRQHTERLHVDWTACDARGTCLELLPELLEADDWGYPRARTGEAAPAVVPRLRAAGGARVPADGAAAASRLSRL